MSNFTPSVVYINPKIYNYKTGIKTVEKIKSLNIPIIESRSVTIKGHSSIEKYVQAKKIIYLTVNGQKKLRSCKPSADYQFSLSSSCPGHCEYCYLQTTQGEKPFMKIYVNIEEILQTIHAHIDNTVSNLTTFECGSITDPIALDYLTNNLSTCIEYFANQPKARLRVITKFHFIDPYLNLKHNNHTKFRFSINTPYVINTFEHGTSNFQDRINAIKKIGNSGYPIGFIIAPIMIYSNWKEDYKLLITKLKSSLLDYSELITFELIQHRFTSTAKELILKRFPNTSLDMNEESRILKWGPYGKFKYVYPKEKSSEIKEYLSELIDSNFSNYKIEYFT